MDSLDRALDTFRNSDHPEFSTHGPIAAEALDDLGFADRAPAWAREYRANLRPLPDSETPLPAGLHSRSRCGLRSPPTPPLPGGR
jgi:hypothetical protein